MCVDQHAWNVPPKHGCRPFSCSFGPSPRVPVYCSFTDFNPLKRNPSSSSQDCPVVYCVTQCKRKGYNLTSVLLTPYWSSPIAYHSPAPSLCSSHTDLTMTEHPRICPCLRDFVFTLPSTCHVLSPFSLWLFVRHLFL